jgi:hypothetical protein
MIESEGAKTMKSVALAYAKMLSQGPESEESDLAISPDAVELDEAITAELTASQLKRLLAERMRILADQIDGIYVRTLATDRPENNGTEATSSPSNYAKHDTKIAKMHEDEIKNLMHDVIKFEKTIAKCIKSINKANQTPMKN